MLFRLIRAAAVSIDSQWGRIVVGVVALIVMIVGLATQNVLMAEIWAMVVVIVVISYSGVGKVRAWAGRHIAGQELMFLTELLDAWERGFDDPEQSIRRKSHRQLRREQKEAVGNMHLAHARLAELAELMYLFEFEGIPAQYRKILMKRIMNLIDRAEEPSEPRLKSVSLGGMAS